MMTMKRVLLLLLLIVSCVLYFTCSNKDSTINDLPMLLLMLEDEDPKIRMEAAFGIGHIGVPAKEAIPELTLALDDKEWHVRGAAAYALGEMGSYAKTAGDTIAKLLGKADDELQSLAMAVEKIQPDPNIILPPLIKALDTDREVARFKLIKAIASYGSEAIEAIPKLTFIAENDSDDEVREEALKAIRRIKGTE